MLPPHETFPYHFLSLNTLTLVVSGEGTRHLAGLAARSFSPVVVRYATACSVQDDQGGERTVVLSLEVK